MVDGQWQGDGGVDALLNGLNVNGQQLSRKIFNPFTTGPHRIPVLSPPQERGKMTFMT